jgi:hypothetical protein
MNETWEQVYNSACVDMTLNTFQDTLVRHYEASFPITYVKNRGRHNKWITKGIRISCARKRELFLKCRNSRDNKQMRKDYKQYCTILTRVINQAKNSYIERN